MMSPPKRRFNRCRLPDELLEEILSILSVKTLLRFRCVSHSWRSLIDDSKFARLRLTRYKNSGLGESRLVAQIMPDSNFEYELWCSKTLKTTARLDSHGFVLELDNVISEFDGLFVLSDMFTRQVMFWNPSIRQTRLIPNSPEFHKGMIEFEFGLGFSSAINDYKYVTSAHTHEHGLKFFEVYTLGTNSWKKIEFQSLSSYFLHLAESIKNVCVEGVLYAINRDMDYNFNVVSFDLKNDRFGSFSLPDDDDPTRFVHALLTVCDGGRSLALVRVNHDGGYLWVRQTTTWAKYFSFDFSVHVRDYMEDASFLYLKTNGELLLECNSVLALINLETKEQKIVPKTCEEVFNVWPYTENLLMLN